MVQLSHIAPLIITVLVITKRYGVRATTIEVQNAFLRFFAFCALRKFHVTDGQNTRDQITRDRRSKRG